MLRQPQDSNTPLHPGERSPKDTACPSLAPVGLWSTAGVALPGFFTPLPHLEIRTRGSSFPPELAGPHPFPQHTPPGPSEGAGGSAGPARTGAPGLPRDAPHRPPPSAVTAGVSRPSCSWGPRSQPCCNEHLQRGHSEYTRLFPSHSHTRSLVTQTPPIISCVSQLFGMGRTSAL